jgi:hypothetical protein
MAVDWQPDADNVYLSSGPTTWRCTGWRRSITRVSALDHLGFVVARPTTCAPGTPRRGALIGEHDVAVLMAPKLHRDGSTSFYFATRRATRCRSSTSRRCGRDAPRRSRRGRRRRRRPGRDRGGEPLQGVDEAEGEREAVDADDLVDQHAVDVGERGGADALAAAWTSVICGEAGLEDRYVLGVDEAAVVGVAQIAAQVGEDRLRPVGLVDEGLGTAAGRGAAYSSRACWSRRRWRRAWLKAMTWWTRRRRSCSRARSSASGVGSGGAPGGGRPRSGPGG